MTRVSTFFRIFNSDAKSALVYHRTRNEGLFLKISNTSKNIKQELHY